MKVFRLIQKGGRPGGGQRIRAIPIARRVAARFAGKAAKFGSENEALRGCGDANSISGLWADRRPAASRAATAIAIVFLTCASPLFAADITSNLLAHWKLDDSGMSADDSSGNGITGMLTNGPTWTTGRIGGALSTDGTNDFVDCGSAVGPASAFSCALWARPYTVASGRQMYAQATFNVQAYCQFFVNTDGVVHARIFDGGVSTWIGRTTPTGTLAVATWSHLCFTWDGGTTNSAIKIHKNGVRVDSADDGSGTFTAANTNSITRRIGAQFYLGSPNAVWSGPIDDVRIYSRALSAADIHALYIQGGPAAQYYLQHQQ